MAGIQTSSIYEEDVVKKLSAYTLSLVMACTLLVSLQTKADFMWPLELAIKATSDAFAAGAATWQISNADTLLQKGPTALAECGTNKTCIASVTDVLAKRPTLEAMGVLLMTSDIIATAVSLTAGGFAIADWGLRAHGLPNTCPDINNGNLLQSIATWVYGASYIATSFSMILSVISNGVIGGVLINDFSTIPSDLGNAVLVTGASTLVPFLIHGSQAAIFAFRLLRLNCMSNRVPNEQTASP